MNFSAEMKVVRFGSEDVIATSGVVAKTITLAGMGDTSAYNNTFTFNGVTYTGASGNWSVGFKSDLADYFGDANLASASDGSIYFNNGSVEKNLNTIKTGQANTTNGFNGTYVYDGNLKFIVKQ